ncbi:presqualene diphosphate synthase HpnD [Niveibacterium terrae]|uniref:presqualene diphosphate synthase HpnD n=1 Tax=Niveibacterium terrae TaxID=3373598 RepID=UPI003A8CE1DE
MTPDEYCQQKAAASGSSFYYSFLFLPAPRRRAITALYAFCREIDDVVDECPDPQIAAAKLGWWRQELARVYAGSPEHPVGQALASVVKAFGLPQSELAEIVDGMEMDLTQSRYLDFKGLELYCHRVAGVVGLLAARIFGYSNERTREYAHELGLAFQLTNIVRDVGEDALRGRIYLPIEDLQRFNVPAHEILARRESEAFRALIEFEIGRAEEAYQRAFALLPAEDRKSQKPGLIMAAIYRTLLVEIRADGCKVLTQRTSLPTPRKLWLAAKTALFG